MESGFTKESLYGFIKFTGILIGIVLLVSYLFGVDWHMGLTIILPLSIATIMAFLVQDVDPKVFNAFVSGINKENNRAELKKAKPRHEFLLVSFGLLVVAVFAFALHLFLNPALLVFLGIYFAHRYNIKRYMKHV